MTSSGNNLDSTPTTQDDEAFDPREAARLLSQTQRQSRRRFSDESPALSIVSALAVLVVYGALWSSTRNQHPYRGPSLDAVGWVYLTVAIGILVTTSFYVRAHSGVSGRSQREARIFAIPIVASIVGVYLFDGALKYDGFGVALVYGIVDASAPWIVVGAVTAGLAAAKNDWWKLAGAVAMILIGAGAAFAGPHEVWGILAVAGCALLLVQATLRVVRDRQA